MRLSCNFVYFAFALSFSFFHSFFLRFFLLSSSCYYSADDNKHITIVCVWDTKPQWTWLVLLTCMSCWWHPSCFPWCFTVTLGWPADDLGMILHPLLCLLGGPRRTFSCFTNSMRFCPQGNLSGIILVWDMRGLLMAHNRWKGVGDKKTLCVTFTSSCMSLIASYRQEVSKAKSGRMTLPI